MLAWKHRACQYFHPNASFRLFYPYLHKGSKKNCFEFELLRVKPRWLVSWCFETSQPHRCYVGSLFTNEEQKEALPMKDCAAFDTFATRQPSLHCDWCRLLGNNYSHVFMTFKHWFLTNRMWNWVKHCCVYILYSIAFETMHDASLFWFPFKFLCHANTDHLPTQTTCSQTTCPQGCFLQGGSRQ